MGAVEEAIDAAANFIGPFVDKDRKYSGNVSTSTLVDEALSHLQKINSADLAADPNAPYDASLAGVVYGLLDLIATLAIIPPLSPGVAFSQRPRSVLTAAIFTPDHNLDLLATVIEGVLPILKQKNGPGVQPLLSQRMLPDIFSALAELSYSPASTEEARSKFTQIYTNLMEDTPTSRLLPILTTYLQQPLPAWFKPVVSTELSKIPLRQQGIRHTVEFLSLSYLSKNSHVPMDASGPQSQIPIPLEAITQASKLLSLPPSGFSLHEWVSALSPELWDMLDSKSGKELARAGGHIIAGGFLSKKTTGAPGTAGWETFAAPLLRSIYPKDVKGASFRENGTLVPEKDFKLSLRRLDAIVTSYSHAGLLRRLISPVLLPLWALFNYAKARPSLDKEWSALPSSILSRYMEIACDAKQIDCITTKLFWDGDTAWTLGPGSEGGVEIRHRSGEKSGGMDSIFAQISGLDTRVKLLVSLLRDAKISDDVAGSVFLAATKAWLVPAKSNKTSLMDDDSIGDPLSALTNAKLAEALAQIFQENFARSPQHIVELMAQLIHNFVGEQKARAEKAEAGLSTRAMLGKIVQKSEGEAVDEEGDSEDEDLVSFALSILNTLVGSPDFKQTPATTQTLQALIPSLSHIAHPPPTQSTSPLLSNAATTLIHQIAPPIPTPSPNPTAKPPPDPLAPHRATLKTCLTDLHSPSPPNRTWAVHKLHTLLKSPSTFPIIDIPSLTHTLLSAALSDPESYVHLAAIPVLVDLAIRAPSPVLAILLHAFLDTDERSLKTANTHTQHGTEEQILTQALDFRLRIGEVLNNYILSPSSSSSTPIPPTHLQKIIQACLSLASRRGGSRTQTQHLRNTLTATRAQKQKDAEQAWGGCVPDLFLEPGDDGAEFEALRRVVEGGWGGKVWMRRCRWWFLF
ncbi:hypothetical protein BDW02DRAFT_344277 [Decorospora gaudefroyi]|uniref:RNA polymerase II assembly factor Rtp1 C-terminal domain-containing protein n=1 Tax=Decorospora gaudefroyi TaxID=184978 RepID=A0A6A5K8T8_9PLEO|nr:hypothetical protein BDW02DRAFT_344277 [Decorospora gaudefroyi]